MRHLRIILILSSIALVGSFLFFVRTGDLSLQNAITIESFMRNTTWGTDFWPKVPYKKGDEVEYSFLLSSGIPREVRIHTDALEKDIDITGMEIDGRKVDRNAIDTLILTGSSLLRITGKTKDASERNGEGMDNTALIDVEILKTEELPPSKKEPPTEIPTEDPKNLRFKTVSFNSNINNLLTITGKNLESIAFVNIGGIGFKPVFASGSVLIAIDRDTFATGEYFALLQLTSGKIITMDSKIRFEHSNSRINIANIAPASIRNDTDRFLVIQGNGFDKIVSVQMSNNLVLKNAEFTIINDRVAGVKIPKGLPPGEYYFNIMDTKSIYELTNMKFRITE